MDLKKVNFIVNSHSKAIRAGRSIFKPSAITKVRGIDLDMTCLEPYMTLPRDFLFLAGTLKDAKAILAAERYRQFLRKIDPVKAQAVKAVKTNLVIDIPEAPKTEAPKKEEPKKEAPKTEAPKTEAPKKEEPKKEAPKKEEPKKEAPKKEEPKKTKTTNKK